MLKKLLIGVAFAALFFACSGPNGPMSEDSQTNDTAAESSIEERLEANYTKHEYRIPMRDGIELYTVVYYPVDSSRSYPILMQRTPYSCKPYGPDQTVAITRNKHLMDDGYIFVRQDVRGRWMSDGEWDNMRPFLADTAGGEIDEGTDTYDTVDWLIKHLEGHNSRVGVYGISYPGFYAAAASVRAHPAVKAVSPQAPVSDFYFDDFHHRGAYTLLYWPINPVFGFQSDTTSTSWYTDEFPDPDNQDPYQFYMDHSTYAEREAFKPEGDFFWEQIKNHPNYDDFWRARSILPHLQDNHVAVLTVGGLFDAEDLYGPFNIYRTLENLRGDVGQANTIIMGPWSHGDWSRDKEHQVVGDMYFGSNLSNGFKATMEAPFFRKHLHEKGDFEPAEALIYNTGTCRWDTFATWPPTDAVAETFWLAPNGVLSNQKGELPTENSFISDPSKPVPYRAAADLSWRFTPRPYMCEDQRFAARRQDVLVYESLRLDEDLTLSGELLAELFVSTTQSDADWVVKLIDVFPGDSANHEHTPEGSSLANHHMMVRSEIMRGRYRNSFENPEPMTPNRITEIQLPLQGVNHTFKKGHKIQVQIQSTWFPLFDRNPQRYVENIFEAEREDYVKAKHTVYQGGAQASRIQVMRR